MLSRKAVRTATPCKQRHLEGAVGFLGGIRVPPARRSAGVFRLQPLASITIPTSVRMNIAASVSTGNICDGIVIGGGCRLGVMEMKFDPFAVSSPVFRFPRCATHDHTVCQQDMVLQFRESHLSSHAPGIITFFKFFRQHRMKSLSGGGGLFLCRGNPDERLRYLRKISGDSS